MIEIANQTFLGIVRKVMPEVTYGPKANLEPLYQKSEDGKSWVPIEDVSDSFPNRGLVSWLKIPPALSIGSLWQFRLEMQPSYAADNQRHDKYKIEERTPTLVAKEVLDFGNIDEAELRRRLAVFYLPLDYVPLNQVYLKIPGDRWFGPVPLKYEDGKVKYDAEYAKPIPVIAPPPPEMLAVLDLPNDGGRRIFFAPSAKNPQIIGQVDWAPDGEIVKRVLKALGKRSKEYAQKLDLTDKAVELMVQQFWPNGNTLEDTLLQDRIRRAQEVMHQAVSNHSLLMEFEEEFTKLPSVKDRLAVVEAQERKQRDEALREEYDRLRAERLASLQAEIEAGRTKARAEIEKETQAAQQQLKKLKEQVAQTQKTQGELAVKCSALKVEIVEQEEKLQAQVHALEGALSERIQQLMNSPQDVLADVAIFRAALGMAQAPAEPNHNGSEPVSKPTHHAVPLSTAPDGQQLTEFGAYKKSVRAWFGQESMRRRTAEALHASLQAGAVPLLAGADAYAVLQAYADAALGGMLHWVPISANIVQWSNLFGTFDSAAGRFIPYPGGLADLVLAAQLAPQQMHLAVLDGVNRAAVEMYLEPLLACYADAQFGRTGRRLSVVHPSCLDPSSPYSSLAGFQWPANLLLTGIVSDGLALPLPQSVWQYAALVDAGIRSGDSDELWTPGKTKPVRGCVSRSVWQAWRSEAQGSADDAMTSLLDSLADAGSQVSRLQRQIDQAFYAAARMWLAGSDSALSASLSLAAASCLVPQVASPAVPEGSETLRHVFADRDADFEPVQGAIELLEKIA